MPAIVPENKNLLFSVLLALNKETEAYLKEKIKIGTCMKLDFMNVLYCIFGK